MRRTSSLLALVALAIPAALPGTAPAAAAPYAERERLIIEPGSGTILTLEGRYPQKKDVCPYKQPKPLRAKYRGRLELARADDGRIQVVNQLSFSNYLRGVAEVPFSWPAAALRAQVIAARSYALATQRDERERAKTRGYDICATVLCQVYRGAHVELGAFGERWVDAVEDTRGRALTYRDRVIKAFYFSTSTGRTRSSFAGGAGPPWLPSVDGEDDDAPLARWTARIELRDLGPILRAAGRWPGGTITTVAQDGDDVRVSGGGTSRRMSKNDFRIALNNEAPCLYPSRYPTEGSATGAKLPQTVPSSRFTLSQDGGTAVARGRGWGHDVGMSQFGARSLAERGRSARQILGHYYGPARVETVKEPASIRVLAAEGLRRVSISFDGPVRIRSGTGSVLRPGTGLDVRGGETLRIRRERGPSLKPVLDVRPTTTRLDALPGSTASLPFETSRPVRVTVELRARNGIVQTTEEQSFESGERTVSIALTDDAGTPLPPGDYEAIVEAYDGLDRIRTTPVAVVITAPLPTPADTPRSEPAGRTLPLALGALLAALATTAWWTYRRRLIRT